MLKVLLGVARVNFLTLAIMCVGLAAALSWYEVQQLNLLHVILVLIMALAAHISVNAFNEYFDFRSGLDFLTQRTPFSGGSGTLIKSPDQVNAALVFAIFSLALVIVLGLGFASITSWHLLWLGVPGSLLIYSYTKYINRWPFLCLLAPGLGFGLFMNLGASWVFSGSLSLAAWLVALQVSLLVSNILLLNQFPDVEADRQVGRQHYPITLGRPASAKIFVSFLATSYLLLLIGCATGVLPWASLLGLISLPLALPLAKNLLAKANQVSELTSLLGQNVLVCHLYLVGLLVGLWWAA